MPDAVPVAARGGAQLQLWIQSGRARLGHEEEQRRPDLADGVRLPAVGGGAGRVALGGQEPDGVSQIGAALFSLVAQARAAGLDPELELRAAARCYRDRVRHWAEEQDGELA